MPLTILSDTDVSALLHSLGRDDILQLQQSLADALHYYSSSTASDAEGNGCSSSYQPQRTQLKRWDGGTTLFMPASSNAGLGVKIVTLAAAKATKGSTDREEGREATGSASASQTSADNTTNTNTTTTTTTTTSNNATASSQPSPIAARGTLTLLDGVGAPRALVNAAELTAFRTALASTMLFKNRASVHDVTVFGAGRQAYWHVRLALLLRGAEVHHLNVVNKGFERAREMVMELFQEEDGHGEGEGEGEGEGSRGAGTWVSLHRPKIALLTPLHTEYARHLENHVRASSVLFLCTPSRAPLFPASFLTSTEGRLKGRYVAAIGSYTPDMIEIPPEVLWQAIKGTHGHHMHRHAKEGGAVVVDTVEGAMKEAGEVVQAGVGGDGLVELGELIMLGREARARREEADKDEEAKRAGRSRSKSAGRTLSRSKSRSRKSLDKEGVQLKGRAGDGGDGGLRDWLEKGNVIYKSVGLGLMDVVVGLDLVELADQRGVGTRVLRF